MKEIRNFASHCRRFPDANRLFADNNTAVQRRQIDSLIQSGVDLLIISPNEFKPLSPCVEKAKRKGIPVILFERKTSSNDYTAYIGGDNTEAGRAIGRYAA